MAPRVRSGVCRNPKRGVSAADIAHTDTDAALFTDARWQQLAESLRLSPRQCQIARCICNGHTYKDIAAHAGISINTVRMHMRALFERLGAHDRLSAVLRIVRTEQRLPDRGEPRRNRQSWRSVVVSRNA